ncbi:MAG TPA: ABC transporter ATP-binding protein [Streptosporangiaceae bacterium]|jgi:putative ABC transport system ATP-binding protein
MPTATSFTPLSPADVTGPPPAEPVVLDAVSKRYGRRRHGVQALQDVSVTFPRGSLTAVMGLSGSGKSTLLQCAAGLDKPTSGTVRLADTDIGQLSRRKLSVLRRRRVGFVFQSLNLVPTLSVAENIALPLRLDHRRARSAHIGQLAERVGLGDKLKRMPGTLSGGQQQRVAIARALVTDPDVIFADEPTGALDPVTAEGVLRLLRAAVDELGKTVVVVTHDPGVTRYADQVLFLDRGRVALVSHAPDPAQAATVLRDLAGVTR